jgi:hypothetical protein
MKYTLLQDVFKLYIYNKYLQVSIVTYEQKVNTFKGSQKVFILSKRNAGKECCGIALSEEAGSVPGGAAAKRPANITPDKEIFFVDKFAKYEYNQSAIPDYHGIPKSHPDFFVFRIDFSMTGE